MTGSRVVKLYRKGMGSQARRAVLARGLEHPAGRRVAIRAILDQRPWNPSKIRNVFRVGSVPDILA